MNTEQATALIVAITADVLQWCFGPFGWAGADQVIDIVAMICTCWLLGFHPLLLPTALIEFFPVVDWLPTWTGCVLLVIARRKNAFLMMNRYPYTVGHLMVVPYRKVAELSAFGENELVELWNLVVHAQALLRAAVKAQGFNIGLNLGECAGAGVPDHLHIHIVPRWSGDTNFMPIIGGARVLSDGLRALYGKLMEAQEKMALPR